jgi:Skp family chaperone for outer membrane proteins
MKTLAVAAALALSVPLFSSANEAGQPPSGARPHAAPRDPGVNAHQHRQQHRIQQGARSGELTRAETRELRTEQKEIRQMERNYKSDGQLTKQERVDLRQEQNAAGRNIYAEKHDADQRPRAQ